MSNPINDNFNSQSSAVPAVAVTDVDSLDLLTGEDTRSQTQGGTDPNKDNTNPVRSETETEGA